MASAGTVTVDFAAEVAKFNAQLGTIQKSLKGVEANFKEFKKTTDLVFGAVAASGIIAFAKSVFTAVDALGDVAERAGIAADTLSRLKFAAEQSDVEFTELTIGIKNFQQNLSEANDGVESAVRTFALLGIQAERLSGLNLEQQLGEIADAFKNIADPADRTRIAVELFGRSGQALIPMLIQGKEGIAALTAEADRLGITLDNTTVKAIDEADKAIKRLKATLDSITAKTLAGLSIMLFGPPDEVQRIDNEVDKLNRRLDFLRNLKFPTRGGWVQLFGDEITATEKKVKSLLERQKELLGLQNIPLLPKIPLAEQVINVPEPHFDLADIGKEERAAAEKALKLQQDIAIERGQQAFKFAEEDRKFREDLAAQVTDDAKRNAQELLQVSRDTELQRMQIVLEAETQIAGLRQNAFNLSISLLQTLGQRNKAFAIAALVFETAMAVKKILLSTNVAAAAALEPPPIGAGPIAGIPLAASIRAWGYANAALTAGLGIAQIANVASPRSGGPPLGTPANPLVTQGGGGISTPAEAQRSVQIIFNGPVAGEQAFKELIEDLFDRDVVVIQQNTRQAQVIRGT